MYSMRAEMKVLAEKGSIVNAASICGGKCASIAIMSRLSRVETCADCDIQ